MNNSTELVAITIPADDLEAVIQLVADRTRARSAGAASSQESETDLQTRTEDKTEAWSTGLLTRLTESTTTTAQQLALVLDVLATDPRGQREYNRAQLVEETGIPMSRLSVMFTKIGSHIRANYGTTTWPLLGEDGAHFTPERAGTWYWLPAVVAERWKQVRGL